MTKRRTANNEVPDKVSDDRKPEVKLIEKDLRTYMSLEALSESEGGKILVDNLIKDIVSLLDLIGMRYKTSSHAELLGICADLDNKATILRLITRAKKNKELAQEALAEALKDTGENDG